MFRAPENLEETHKCTPRTCETPQRQYPKLRIESEILELVLIPHVSTFGGVFTALIPETEESLEPL